MTERKLIVSFGSGKALQGNEQLAIITAVSEATWAEFANLLTTVPPEADDKASRGWYCPAEFSPRRRHGANLIARHTLAFDYDVIAPSDLKKIQEAFAPYEYAIYTTWSHTAEKPRIRVVMPTTRPMSADEFCAVSRRIASLASIELAARESHKPAQMMFQPTRKPGAKFFGRVHAGEWLDVEKILATYEDWTDRSSWPKHSAADDQYSSDDLPPRPSSKPGIVGEFCRAFDVPTAIERFELPYEKTANPNRYTYTAGSRPEGAVLYDSGEKLHSHHDSDVAHGQHNAYDLVRLHHYGHLDVGHAGGLATLPSTKAMVDFARSLPELQRTQAESEFEVVSPSEEKEDVEFGRSRFAVVPAEEFAVGAPLTWIVKSLLPRAELVVLYGESGAGKSFLAFDLSAAVSAGRSWQNLKTFPGRVVYVCAEGAAGFRNRLNAYSRARETVLSQLPAVVPNAPNLLEVDDVLDLSRAVTAKGKIDLLVIDTLAATTPGGNENSGEDMGRVLAHCKAMHRATGALVLLVHHSGKDAAKGARGWSGIKAAADAEIEVTRDGEYRTVRVTKMKDGRDGQSWMFKLAPIVLGMDDDGDEISSCVVEFIQPEEKVPRPALLGARQRLVLTTATDLLAEKGDCYVSDLLDRVVAKLPNDEGAKRDYRRKNARDAMQYLIDRNHLFLHGDDRVSTTSAVQASNDEFEEKATA